jgi:hypothetical protein
MPDGLDMLLTALSLPPAVAPIRSIKGQAEQRRFLAEERNEQSQWRSSLRDMRGQLDRIYREAVQSDYSSDDLLQVAKAFLKKQVEDAERMRPSLEALGVIRREVADSEVQACIDDSLTMAAEWLALYEDIRGRLLGLVSSRSGAVLRARPVEGEVDWAELSREHIARYPKIRARLAE